MTVRVVGFLANGASGTAEDARIVQSFYGAATDAFGIRSGRRSVFDLIISPTDPVSMGIVVGPGQVLVDASISGKLGGYVVSNDAPITITVPPADQQYARIDLLVARVRDTEIAGNPTDPLADQGSIEIVPGTPSPSPIAPDPAAGEDAPYEVLGTINVQRQDVSITSSDISSARNFASALNAPLYVDALPSSGVYPGLRAWHNPTAQEYVWYGAWYAISNYRWPRGRIARKQLPATVPSSGGLAAYGALGLWGTEIMSQTFTAEAGRKYRIDTDVQIVSSTTGDTVIVGIFLDAATTPIKAIPIATFVGIVPTNSRQFMTFIDGGLTPGTHTIHLKAARLNGTGNNQIYGDANHPTNPNITEFVILDDGA